MRSYGAMGFYPGDPLSAGFEATMMRAGMNTPIWFNEFTAGGPGYYGTPGRSRMWAHFGLLLGRAGSDALDVAQSPRRRGTGAVRPDRPRRAGHPGSWRNSRTVAKEFAKLEKLGFPRLARSPRWRIAYSFDNMIAPTCRRKA